MIREETGKLSTGFSDTEVSNMDQSQWIVLVEDRELKCGCEAGHGRMLTETTLFKSFVGKVIREKGNS